MFLQTSAVALGLLRVSQAITTVTVRVNTGDCPATYSSSGSSSSLSTTATDSTTPSSSTGTLPAITGYSRDPCPTSIGYDYINEQGIDYQVFCNTQIVGSDLIAVNATSLSDCFAQCDSYAPALNNDLASEDYCVAVSYTAADILAGNCELKYDVANVVFGTSPADSGKLADWQVSPAISSSIGAILATATGTGGAISSPTGTDGATTSPTGTTDPGTTDPGTTDPGTTDPGTTDPPTLDPSTTTGTCDCPTLAETIIADTLGFPYSVHCDQSFAGLNAEGAINAATLDDCAVQCDNYNLDGQTCVSITYQPDDPEDGNNCFLAFAEVDLVPAAGACLLLYNGD